MVKYFRFAVGNEVRLKGAYFVTCTDFVKDENGKVVEEEYKGGFTGLKFLESIEPIEQD